MREVRNLYLISNLYHFFVCLLWVAFIYNVHSFLDNREKDECLHKACKLLVYISIISILFSLLSSLPPFKMTQTPSSFSQKFAFFSSFLSPVVTYLSTLTVVCSGGACSQIYVSTITSLLGAFGVSLSNLSKFMFPITLVLIVFSLVSLYVKRRKLTHGPFLLGIVGAIFIIFGQIFNGSFTGKVVSYIGNAVMIGAAVWNMRKNKLYGIPKFYK